MISFTCIAREARLVTSLQSDIEISDGPGAQSAHEVADHLYGETRTAVGDAHVQGNYNLVEIGV